MSASGVAVLVNMRHTGNRYGLRGSEFAPEVHYFSCAGTRMSVMRSSPSGCARFIHPDASQQVVSQLQ